MVKSLNFCEERTPRIVKRVMLAHLPFTMADICETAFTALSYRQSSIPDFMWSRS
jgi:hypothetical protein